MTIALWDILGKDTSILPSSLRNSLTLSETLLSIIKMFQNICKNNSVKCYTSKLIFPTIRLYAIYQHLFGVCHGFLCRFFIDLNSIDVTMKTLFEITSHPPISWSELKEIK